MASRHPLWMAFLMLVQADSREGGAASGHRSEPPCQKEGDGLCLDEGCSLLQKTVEFSRLESGLGYLAAARADIAVDRANCVLARGSKRQHPEHIGNLSFIHIPRNAGTSIEECSKRAPEAERWSHENPEMNSRLDKDVTHCYLHHVPPSLRPGFYEGRDTFCVVRNPYDRAISQLGFVAIFFPEKHSCNATSLNDYLRERFETLARHPYRDDCHFLPQAAYVYGWDKKTKSVIREGKRSCKTVLRYESLDRDFNRTMERSGLPYRLGWKSVSGLTESARDCHKLGVKDLEEDVRKLVEKAWEVDFDLLGYKRLSASQ
mmetsp:Transcript_31132/g.70860  ORF Transcript_31132/g.70860 Transcript_31132/m.70860 type:complete len:318 (-) Transcript_31132:93-1046(-)